jgi:hypothetical protein
MWLCDYQLSLIILYSYIYIIYLVTLTLYEKIDKDMVMLSIITCSDAHCSISLVSLPSGKNINNDTWITPGSNATSVLSVHLRILYLF